MRISIRLIEVFVRVVESGSFVAAARSLLIDPAAVSRAIKGLEDALGVQLFTRSTRLLKLTTEGRRFYRDAVAMLRNFQETVQRFRAETAVQGQLKIGMGPALSRRMVLKAVPSFQQLYPDVRLVFVSVNDPAEIGDEGLDIFIRPRSQRQRRGEHKAPQGAVLKKLTESSIVLCASPDYLKRAGTPRAPRDLTSHACAALLTLEHDVQDEWQLAKSNQREKIKIVPQLIADGEALREAARTGCGIVRVLACNVDEELRSGALLRVLPDWDLGNLPIVAVYRKTPATHARITAFLRHLSEAFARQVASCA